MKRRVVASYSGNLFQLSRTGGGGGTQDIGQTGTAVNCATIHTFCGTNNANTCAYHLLYDQSGNTNTATAHTDVTFTWDGSWGTCPSPSVTFGTSGQYFNVASPTGLHVGNTDKSIVSVVNDSQFSDCCGMFGQAHDVNASGGSCGGGGTPPDCNGTDFMTMLRASKASDIADSHCRRAGIDLEIDVLEGCYAPDVFGNDALLSAYQSISGWGLQTVIATYTASSQTALVDWNGIYTYSAVYNTNTGGTGLQNCDANNHCDNEIRIGAGGDGSIVFSIWYEGEIYARVLGSGDRAPLESNDQGYYGFSNAELCSDAAGSESLWKTLGESNITALWGLRRDNHYNHGPIAVLNDGSTNHVIGAANGSCNFDTATAATDCPSSCTVVVLDNQIFSNRFRIGSYTTGIVDGWRMDSAGTAPGYSGSCVNSLPCLTFTSTQGIGTHSAQSWPQPYTLLAFGKNTSSNFGGMLASVSNNHPYLGMGSATNSALFQADDGGGATCTSCATNGTFFAFTGEANDGTHVSVFVNGSQTGPTSATVTNSSTSLEFGKSNSFTGSVTQGMVTIGTAIASGTVSTLATKLGNYW